MKILISSIAFYPSLGGLESVSLTLAEELTKRGFNCKVVTKSVSDALDNFLFEVLRNPSFLKKIELVQWADVILFNGASLMLQPLPILFRKPFIWVHTGYQVSSIDGLGWLNGNPAPINPVDSFLHHKRVEGVILALQNYLKLTVKRSIAKHFVTYNIAITKWMASTQILPRQIQIYNPIPLSRFMTNSGSMPEFEFVFLGRLVKEKGVSTLLIAFAKLLKITNGLEKLLIIGSGPEQKEMIQLAIDLKINESVIFKGKKSGTELVDNLAKCMIGIVPSSSFEPMGIVAIELLAAGKNIIVSELGGLKECVGEAGLTFPNQDADELAKQMLLLLQNEELRRYQLTQAKMHLEKFNIDILINQYISLLNKISKRKS